MKDKIEFIAEPSKLCGLIPVLRNSKDQYLTLCASTAHLTEDDRLILSSRAADTLEEFAGVKRFNMIAERDTGYFLKLYEEWEYNETSELLAGLSSDAMTLIQAAYEAGYRMIEFDRDAEEYSTDYFNRSYLADKNTEAEIFESLKNHLRPRLRPEEFESDVIEFMGQILEGYSGEFIVLAWPGDTGATIVTLRETDEPRHCDTARDVVAGTERVKPSFYMHGRQNVGQSHNFLKVIDRKRAKSLIVAYCQMAAGAAAKRSLADKQLSFIHGKIKPTLANEYTRLLKAYLPGGIKAYMNRNEDSSV